MDTAFNEILCFFFLGWIALIFMYDAGGELCDIVWQMIYVMFSCEILRVK